MSNKKEVKVGVLASSSVGPVIFTCVVNCTQEEYDSGCHYDAAEELAEEEGYERPMYAFDQNDEAARQLAAAAKFFAKAA